MNKNIFDQINNDFESYSNFPDSDWDFVINYILWLKEIIDIDLFIEQYSNASQDNIFLNKTVWLLISLISLWNFLLKKDELLNLDNYYNSVKNISKKIDLIKFQEIFNKNNNFMSSLRLSNFKDELPNKISEIKIINSTKEFENNKYIKTVDINIKYWNETANIIATIWDLKIFKDEIDNAIKNLENNNIQYEYYI